MSSLISQAGLLIHLRVFPSLDGPFCPEEVIRKDLSALLKHLCPSLEGLLQKDVDTVVKSFKVSKMLPALLLMNN